MIIDKLTASRSAKRFSDLVAQADMARDALQWQDAARLYDAALKIRPGDAAIWMQYGHGLKESGEYAAAELAYRRAIEIQPLADSFLQLGHLYKLSNQTQLAEENYLHAFEMDASLNDAKDELVRLGWSGTRLSSPPSSETADLTPGNVATSLSPTIVFELSDLIDFIQKARYPTGIQRVQLELAEALLASRSRACYVYFDNTDFIFKEISSIKIKQIVDLMSDAGRPEPLRRAAAERLRSEVRSGGEYVFPKGSTLVNVGTSWGYHNYFMVIREMKRRYGTRYAPLVHDTIPILFPEFCDENLVADFLNWFEGMAEHADIILANSQNTLNDVKAVFDELGKDLPRGGLLLLNGAFRKREESDPDEQRQAEALLRSHGLDVEDYVLMVSTIEPRKNHALALNAWSTMLKTRDRRTIPYLVCVGAPGWMNEAMYERLRRDQNLAERVIFLLNVSDQQLNKLYDRALFTIFPSLYEGWGLPISEALAHGKVPLVSNVSAHPEAGGEHAVYFDLGSERDFQMKLEALIDDTGSRLAREAAIRQASPLRPWARIAGDLVAFVNDTGAQARSAATRVPALVPGRYYVMSRNKARQVAHLKHRSEQFRIGINWEGVEDWGCWIRDGSGELQFRLPADAETFQIYLHLSTPRSSLPSHEVIIGVPQARWTMRTQVASGADFWRSFGLSISSGCSRTVILRLAGSPVVDFRLLSDGEDQRSSGLAVLGIYVARADSEAERLALVEAIQFRDLDSLARREGLTATISA